MRRRTTSILLLTALAALLLPVGCAKQGYPSGGPRDVTPPKVTATTPENGTANFSAKEFRIAFDEYVVIKDAENNILVSPPMKHKPEYGTRGHSVVVKITDTLRENTTYLFQFKGGIVDFNEGNPLPSFEYVFSTGGTIDSMTLRGVVLDALTLQPRKEAVTVTAYAEDSVYDSIVALEQPIYMTRCDAKGRFSFNHIREGRYRLFAFEDGDKNLRLGANEAMAFLDSVLTAEPMPVPVDTTARAANDSSAAQPAAAPLPPTKHRLRVSLLAKETQRVDKSAFLHRGRIEIVTKQPLSDRYSLRPLEESDETLYTSLNARRDTLSVWTGNEMCDSLVLVLNDTLLSDTLHLQYRQRAGRHATPSNSLSVKSLVASKHPYFDTLRLLLPTPLASDGIASWADTAVRVLDLADSSISYCPVRWEEGVPARCRGYIAFVGKPGGKYRFTLAAGCCRDIYGHPNDSLAVVTEYTLPSLYGSISVALTTTDVDPQEGPLLIQLLSEKGDIVQQQMPAGGKVTFQHLKEGKYTLRAVADRDGDGQWTPGDYWQHRQPEEVYYLGKTLELRENWDMEEKWAVGAPSAGK